MALGHVYPGSQAGQDAMLAVVGGPVQPCKDHRVSLPVFHGEDPVVVVAKEGVNGARPPVQGNFEEDRKTHLHRRASFGAFLFTVMAEDVGDDAPGEAQLNLKEPGFDKAVAPYAGGPGAAVDIGAIVGPLPAIIGAIVKVRPAPDTKSYPLGKELPGTKNEYEHDR